MKNLMLTIFIAFCATLALGHPGDVEKMDKMMKVVTGCQAKTSASAEDVKMMMSKQEPTSHEGKCMFNCLLEGIEILKDGKINKAMFMPWMAMQKGSSEKIAEEVYNECNLISDDDPCEHGTKIARCFRETCAKHGVDCTY